MALSIIQGYLINNTYILKKEAFVKETKNKVARVDDVSEGLEPIYDEIFDEFEDLLVDYKIGLIEKSELIEHLQQELDAVNDDYIKIYHADLAELNLGYNLFFQKQLKAIILLDSLGSDTIFTDRNGSLRFLGDDFDTADSHMISKSHSKTDYSVQRIINGKNIKVSFNAQLNTEDRINIEDWRRIIFGKMTGLLALSLLLFFFVIGLLYYSILNLIKQKKIADVRTDFVNNITHELKTPLATLSLATKMLSSPKVKDDIAMRDATVDTIKRQNIRLQNLIDQVMNNSLGYSEIELFKSTVLAEEYINNTLDDFLWSVGDRKITLNRAISLDDESIDVDKFYMTTALSNILENAIKYKGDEVTVHSSIENGNFKISIEDNGIGIEDRDQQYIFDKFYRVGNKDIHNVKGLGLGLYYTDQIIKAHNGHIGLKSTKNKGSNFTITIPLS